LWHRRAELSLHSCGFSVLFGRLTENLTPSGAQEPDTRRSIACSRIAVIREESEHSARPAAVRVPIRYGVLPAFAATIG
jgi:hypothetical protein